jgi:hypothetical protein
MEECGDWGVARTCALRVGTSLGGLKQPKIAPGLPYSEADMTKHAYLCVGHHPVPLMAETEWIFHIMKYILL